MGAGMEGKREARRRRNLPPLPKATLLFTDVSPAPRRRSGTWTVFNKYLFQTLRQRKAIC